MRLTRRLLAMSLVLGLLLAATSVGQAGTMLGTGAGALLGNDLTDLDNVHNEGAYNPGAGDYGGFDAEFFSSDEPGFGGGEYSFNVFDNGVGGGGNKWCCNNVDADGHQLDARILGGAYVLTHFTITSSNDSPNRDPRAFSIEGSNDGTSWTPIFTRSDASTNFFTARNQVWRFDGGGVDFTTPAAYSWFRYNVTATGGGHALNELEYFGVLPPAANDFVWDGTAAGNWVDLNWDPLPHTAFPTAADDATINTASTVSVATGNQAVRQLEISGGGKLVIGSGRTFEALNITAGGGAVDFQNNGQLTVTGSATIGGSTLAGNAIVNASGIGNVSLSNIGETSASSLTKIGTGTLTLPTANTYTGLTNVNEGVLMIRSNNALGTTAGGTVVADGASLNMSSQFNYATLEPLTITGSGIGGTGALRSVSGNNDYRGPITLAGDSTIYMDNNRLRLYGGVDTAGNDLTFNVRAGNLEVQSAPIIGTGNVRKEGNSTLHFWDNAANTYTGETVIADGILDVRSNSSLGTAAGGTTVLDGATLRIRNGRTLADDISITGPGHNNNGAIRSENNSNTLTGQVTLAGDSRIHVNNTQLTLDGVLTGGGALEKQGDGRLVLANPGNDFTGAMAINNGVVSAPSEAALGSPTGSIAVAGGTLEIDGAWNYTAKPLSIAGSGEAGVGAINSVNGDTTITTPVNVTGNAAIGSGTAGSTLTVDGAITLPLFSDLTFTGAGDIVVNTGFGNGGAPITVNGLTAMRFNGGKNASDLDFGAVGAYTVNSDGTVSQASRLLSNTPAVTALQDIALNMTRGGATTPAPGNGPFHWQAVFGSSTAGDQNNFQVAWTGEFSPDANGDFTFRSRDDNFNGGNIDDDASIFIDVNLDGIFQASEGFMSGGGGTVIATGLDSTKKYRIAIGYREGGGNEAVSYTFQGSTGAFTAETGIIPNDAAQTDRFTSTFSPSNSVVKEGTGTTTFNAANTYSGETTIKGGTLIAANSSALGVADGSVATGTSISDGATLALVGDIAMGDEHLTLAGKGATIHNISGINSMATQTIVVQDSADAADQVTIQSDAGSLALGTTGTFDLNYSQLHVTGAGETTIGQKISAQPIGTNIVITIPGIAETIWDSALPNGDVTNNIENARTAAAGSLGASDAQGVLLGRLHYYNDAAVSTRAAELGAVGFNNGDFAMLWTTTFTPDTTGQWDFRFNRTDDRGSVWIDKDQDGVFELNAAGGATNGDERIIVRTGCCGGGTSNWNGFTSGEEYLIGITMNDTGGGGYFRDMDYKLGSSGTWIDFDSSTVNLFNLNIPKVAPTQQHLVKDGTGTLRLTGDNDYDGQTQVNAGTLLINGTTSGQGNYSILAGATLGGSGGIGLAAGGNVTLDPAAILSPGDASADTLSIDGDLIVGEGVNFLWDLGLTGNDTVDVTGDLALDDWTLTLTDLGGEAIARDKLYLFTGYSGLDLAGGSNPTNFNATIDYSQVASWMIFTDPADLRILQDAGGLYLTGLQTVPEPGSIVLLLLGMVGVIGYVRKRHG